MSDSFYLQLLTNYCVKWDRSVAIFCSPGASPPPSIFMSVSFSSSGCCLLLVWVGIFGLVVVFLWRRRLSALGLRPFTLLSDRMLLRLSIRFSRLAVGIQLSLCALKAAKYTLTPIKTFFVENAPSSKKTFRSKSCKITRKKLGTHARTHGRTHGRTDKDNFSSQQI